MSRSDPIREKYYEPVAAVEKICSILFYVGALLSFAALAVSRTRLPNTYSAILIGFAVSVIAIFILGMAVRLYLVPRAEDKRRQDFFSSACGIDLIYQKTDGYYNNDFTDPIKRVAAQVLESSLFSKAIALQMAKRERMKMVVYLVLWLLCLLYRKTELGIVVTASQAIFSEQILARWIRLEWLRMRFERVFDDLYKLFQSRPAIAKFNAMALETFSMYETSKSSAAIILSSKIFEDLNSSLSAEWESVKTTLKM